MRRQHEWRVKSEYGKWFEEKSVDFRYGGDGRLKDIESGLQYPIFECNALCRCDDDCTNRVSHLLLFISLVADLRCCRLCRKDEGWR